jgi:hypothetical protein
MRVALLLGGIIIYLGWKAGRVEAGAAHIEHLAARVTAEEALRCTRETQLDGALRKIGELTGSDPDPALDIKGTNPEESFDDQGADPDPSL